MSLVSDDSRNCRSCLSTPPHFFGFKDHLLVLSYCVALFSFRPFVRAFYYLLFFFGIVIRFLTLSITFEESAIRSFRNLVIR